MGAKRSLEQGGKAARKRLSQPPSSGFVVTLRASLANPPLTTAETV